MDLGKCSTCNRLVLKQSIIGGKCGLCAKRIRASQCVKFGRRSILLAGFKCRPCISNPNKENRPLPAVNSAGSKPKIVLNRSFTKEPEKKLSGQKPVQSNVCKTAKSSQFRSTAFSCINKPSGRH